MLLRARRFHNTFHFAIWSTKVWSGTLNANVQLKYRAGGGFEAALALCKTGFFLAKTSIMQMQCDHPIRNRLNRLRWQNWAASSSNQTCTAERAWLACKQAGAVPACVCVSLCRPAMHASICQHSIQASACMALAHSLVVLLHLAYNLLV